MTIRIPLSHLRAVSEYRPKGYYEAVISIGTIEGDQLSVDHSLYSDVGKRFPTAPSLLKQSVDLAQSVRKAITNPTPASGEEQERRLAICRSCEFLHDGTRCLKCGCHVNWKAILETWHCPIEKW